MDDECLLCGAPGGHPYCNEGCRRADNPDDEVLPPLPVEPRSRRRVLAARLW